ncbi:hypothetical protein QTH49_13340 [Clostridium perfringens]|nr:hypothetical protein [Clostridium perfringens]
MNISDLKDGYVVKLRTGEYGYIKLEERIVVLKDGFLGLDGYDYELLRIRRTDISEDYDIVAIYEPVNFCCGFKGILGDSCEDFCRLVSSRQELKDIDWTKVPSLVKVQVRDGNHEEWRNRYFVVYEDDESVSYPFITAESLKDEFTLCEPRTESFRYCRIHPDEMIKEEWYK